MSKKKAEINAKKFVKSYWNYYIELEQQLWETRRYVDFSKKNNRTFSIEYLKLLQAICSEIDVIAKVIATYVDPMFKGNTINHWGYALQKIFPDIQKSTVVFNDDYDVQPWKNWCYVSVEHEKDGKKNVTIKLADKAKNPQWWTSYNKSKHERTSKYNDCSTNYERANLKHVIEALSALYIIEKLFSEYIFKREDVVIEMNESKLFSDITFG